jgi:hypothetical protein
MIDVDAAREYLRDTVDVVEVSDDQILDDAAIVILNGKKSAP